MLTVDRFSCHGWRPGLIADSAALMSREYAFRFGVGVQYEAWVTTELAAFLTAFDAARCEWWTVNRAGQLVGCAAIDGRVGDGDRAEFRWFCLAEVCRGRGVGRRVLAEAVAWAAQRRLRCLQLHTHLDLSAAVHLYEQAGFVRAEARPGPAWAPHLEFQLYQLTIANEATGPAGAASASVRGARAECGLHGSPKPHLPSRPQHPQRDRRSFANA